MCILDLSSYGTWPRELTSTELEFHVRTECFFTANHRKFTTIMTTDYILVTLHYGCGSGADLFRAIMFFMTPKNCILNCNNSVRPYTQVSGPLWGSSTPSDPSLYRFWTVVMRFACHNPDITLYWIKMNLRYRPWVVVSRLFPFRNYACGCDDCRCKFAHGSLPV